MTDSKEDGAIEADVRELLETLNEWFGQRERGEPTTNSEAVMFREVNGRLNLLDSFTTKKAGALSASSPPVGGSGEVVTDAMHQAAVFRTTEECLRLFRGRLKAEGIAAIREIANTYRSALAAPVPNGVPEGALREFAESFHITVVDNAYSDVTLHLDKPHALSLRLQNGSDKSWLFKDLEARRIAALSASPVTPEGLSGGEPEWPAYVPQVIEYEEGGYAQLLLEDAAVIHAEEMTVTVLRRMSSPEREILGFQWEIPFKENG